MSRNTYSSPLSSRETDVLKVLWTAKEPLHASGIAKISSLSINTVQAVLRKLVSRELVEVTDITYSGTVLSRRYQATATQSIYTINQFLTHYRETNGDMSTPMIIAALLEQEESEEELIKELETMLEERKKKLKGE